MSEIIIYEDPDAPNPVQVTLDGDTVWLTQAQMAELFGRERSVITKHVRNVFRDGDSTFGVVSKVAEKEIYPE